MNQRVLVTAGASGIGREIVRGFAAGGAQLFVCDIDEAGLDALKKELPAVDTMRCDVSKRAEIERMVPAELQSLGGLDVLIASLAVFLASDAGKAISGQALAIDNDMQRL